MRSEDFLALGAISSGALAGVAVSLAVVLSSSFPARGTAEGPGAFAPLPQVSAFDRPIVDFAIIRDGPKVMVGPEGPKTGWNPDSTHPGHRPRR